MFRSAHHEEALPLHIASLPLQVVLAWHSRTDDPRRSNPLWHSNWTLLGNVVESPSMLPFIGTGRLPQSTAEGLRKKKRSRRTLYETPLKLLQTIPGVQYLYKQSSAHSMFCWLGTVGQTSPAAQIPRDTWSGLCWGRLWGCLVWCRSSGEGENRSRRLHEKE